MELWDFQYGAAGKIREAIIEGHRDILLVSPTGSGKTVIASHLMNMATKKYKHSLFLAHRREIVHQTSEKLGRFGCDHGVEMAGERRSVYPQAHVGSIQTYYSRYVSCGRKTPRVDLLFFDEAHRSLAITYQKIRELFPEAILIGLTATPVRGDGKGLGSMYTKMVESVSVEELIQQGFLVRPRVYAPSIPDLKTVGVKAGDYVKSDLELVMDRQELVGNVVKDWQQRAGDRKTVVFASGVKHSMHLCEEFRKAGVAAAHIDGSTPKRQRDEILRDLETGVLQTVTNCDVLLEGWDCPSVSSAILARPTKSYGLYLQMAGRVIRSFDGKDDCIIIDHAGAVYRHGFVEDAGCWSLDPDTKIEDRRGEKEEKDKEPVTCRECFTVYEAQQHCPNCGWVPSVQSKEINMKEGRLREVKRKPKKRDDRQTEWNNCMWRCIKTGKKIGVAAHMYRKKMGVWPQGLESLPNGKAEWNMMAGDFYERYKERHVGH